MGESLEQIVNPMLQVFTDVKDAGISIVVAAIGLGVVFIGGKWLWGKARQWLKAV